MTLAERIESFTELGQIIRDSLGGKKGKYGENLEKLIQNQQFRNGWFTPRNVEFALRTVAEALSYNTLLKWTERYPALEEQSQPRNVAVIMAGNIPLVGFHDFLSVLISGNRIIVRTSSKDPDLIVFIGDILGDINPSFRERIIFTDGLLKEFDAVIATGSDNSSRYFEYYFGKYPHIIRRNRNSIGIIEGNETGAELSGLGDDIFLYFGLGCRSVSKIWVPKGYDVKALAESWSEYAYLINHNKYANNYDYNKAILIVNRDKYIDTGFLLCRDDSRLASPVSVLHYEYYNSTDAVIRETELLRDSIQCIAGRNHTPFGRTQMPELWDYADGVDTLEFLLKKN
ncbi:MAG: aldehyde dehydrogenase [Bacteroidales bacterium]|jgi:hypothetical protein|nr:aldehyde dehydrogenase [Bacteroidales bacterium]